MNSYEAKLIEVIQDDRYIMNLLKAVEQLHLPDGWISAGLIRNKVWDVLHGVTTPIRDIDVVYYDPDDLTWETEKRRENQLDVLMPYQPWSVKNQARMHKKSGFDPFQSSDEGVAHFPETPTAIAVRLKDGELEIMAPYGLDDLFHKVVKPTPYYQRGTSYYPIYQKRMEEKQWDQVWKELMIEQ